MARIFVCGDCHGDYDIAKLASKRFPVGKDLTKDDYVIICGDAGVVWDCGGQDRYIQKWYADKPWTTLFVDGNHENHDALNAYPVTKWNGGKVHKINDSLIHLMRGQYYNIDGRTFYTMGGAASTDRIYRTEGKSWWAAEMPTAAEINDALTNFEAHDLTVDYIITHEAPHTLVSYLWKHTVEHDNIKNYLQFLYENAIFKHWYCGHHHIDTDIRDIFTFTYNEVIELK